MKENLKIELLIEVLKNQMKKLEDRTTFVYQTLDAVVELAESIKNQD
jgi:5-bromo-4-chloroindolyl phosphate hydrolysis protein